MLKRKVLLAAATLFFLPSIAATESQAQTTPTMETFFALLNGNSECNGATPPLCQQGDLDGYGSATVTITSATSLCFGIVVHRLTGASGVPTAAHIHGAPATVNAGILVPLLPPSAGNPGTSSGCVTGLAPAVIAAIRNFPQDHYVNVHNGFRPGGAVRGQLF
jgi:hypothetical protein